MTHPQLARLHEAWAKLKRVTMQARLETFLQEASAQQVTDADFLDRRLAEEVAAKRDQYVAMRTVMAPFPSRKTLENCDFSVQPSVDRQKVQELATSRFIAHGDKVVVLGPPGTGKTHLASGLGLKAVQQGYRTLFTAALPLSAALTKAYAENRLEERRKQYGVPTLLIIEEIGEIPIDRHGAHVVFQLIARRYERGAIILTSNQSFGQGAEVCGDPIIATALLDRLRQHSHGLNMQGDSYRLTEKQKAGLRNKALAADHLSPGGGGDFSCIERGPFSIIVDTHD